MHNLHIEEYLNRPVLLSTVMKLRVVSSNPTGDKIFFPLFLSLNSIFISLYIIFMMNFLFNFRNIIFIAIYWLNDAKFDKKCGIWYVLNQINPKLHGKSFSYLSRSPSICIRKYWQSFNEVPKSGRF